MNFARLADWDKSEPHSPVLVQADFAGQSMHYCLVVDFEDFVETDSAGLADSPAIDSAGPETAAPMSEAAW